MPIQSDQAKPVITINEKGQQVATNSEYKEPKQIDTEGRPVEAFVEAQTSSVPNPTPATPTPQEQEEQSPKNPELDARKLFLKAQKAERKAKENEKKSQDGLKKAEAINAAIKLTNEGGDPTAVLTAVGIDPIKWYQNMTSYALSNKDKAEDPVKKELREHKERLDQYEKERTVMLTDMQQKEDMIAANKIISTQIIPIIQSNPEKYETILLEYGKDTAIAIFNVMKEAYDLPDDQKPAGWKMPTFEEAAERLEIYWAEKVESGIIAASKLKKFSNRFAQSFSNQSNQSEQKETPNRSSFTLSNRQSAQSAPPSKFSRNLTRDERIDLLIKQYGGK